MNMVAPRKSVHLVGNPAVDVYKGTDALDMRGQLDEIVTGESSADAIGFKMRDIQKEVLGVLPGRLQQVEGQIVLGTLLDHRYSPMCLIDPARREDVRDGFSVTAKTMREKPIPLSFFREVIRAAYAEFLRSVGVSEDSFYIRSEVAAKMHIAELVKSGVLDESLAIKNLIVARSPDGDRVLTKCRGVFADTVAYFHDAFDDVQGMTWHLGVRPNVKPVIVNQGVQYAQDHLGVSPPVVLAYLLEHTVHSLPSK